MLWGIPGLFVISFIDAASVPLMGGADVVVAGLACLHPMQSVLIVLAATLGSTLGYLVLYRIALVGGEMALSRFNSERREWIKQKLEQNSFLAIAAGMTAPPPFPTKLVVLAAGAFQVGQVRFLNGVLAGRLLRYSVLAFLGARFGEQAAVVLKDHFALFLIILAATVALLLILRHFRKQAR